METSDPAEAVILAIRAAREAGQALADAQARLAEALAALEAAQARAAAKESEGDETPPS